MKLKGIKYPPRFWNAHDDLLIFAWDIWGFVSCCRFIRVWGEGYILFQEPIICIRSSYAMVCVFSTFESGAWKNPIPQCKACDQIFFDLSTNFLNCKWRDILPSQAGLSDYTYMLQKRSFFICNPLPNPDYEYQFKMPHTPIYLLISKSRAKING